MAFDQGEFRFDAGGDEAGYRHWRAELDAAKRSFERRWGVILGRRVRVVLDGRDDPIEGVIELVPRQTPPTKASALRLSVRSTEFRLCEVVSVTRLDEA